MKKILITIGAVLAAFALQPMVSHAQLTEVSGTIDQEIILDSHQLVVNLDSGGPPQTYNITGPVGVAGRYANLWEFQKNDGVTLTLDGNNVVAMVGTGAIGTAPVDPSAPQASTAPSNTFQPSPPEVVILTQKGYAINMIAGVVTPAQGAIAVATDGVKSVPQLQQLDETSKMDGIVHECQTLGYTQAIIEAKLLASGFSAEQIYTYFHPSNGNGNPPPPAIDPVLAQEVWTYRNYTTYDEFEILMSYGFSREAVFAAMFPDGLPPADLNSPQCSQANSLRITWAGGSSSADALILQQMTSGNHQFIPEQVTPCFALLDAGNNAGNSALANRLADLNSQGLTYVDKLSILQSEGYSLAEILAAIFPGTVPNPTGDGSFLMPDDNVISSDGQNVIFSNGGISPVNSDGTIPSGGTTPAPTA